LQPQDASVKLLSISQLFLLCVRASVAPLRYELHRCVFVIPQCFVATQKFKCIVGLRLGLQGFTAARGFLRPGFSPGKIGFLGDAVETKMVGSRSKQSGPSLHRVDRGFRVMWRIINDLYEEYCQARLDEMLRLDAVKR